MVCPSVPSGAVGLKWERKPMRGKRVQLVDASMAVSAWVPSPPVAVTRYPWFFSLGVV